MAEIPGLEEEIDSMYEEAYIVIKWIVNVAAYDLKVIHMKEEMVNEYSQRTIR